MAGTLPGASGGPPHAISLRAGLVFPVVVVVRACLRLRAGLSHVRTMMLSPVVLLPSLWVMLGRGALMMMLLGRRPLRTLRRGRLMVMVMVVVLVRFGGWRRRSPSVVVTAVPVSGRWRRRVAIVVVVVHAAGREQQK